MSTTPDLRTVGPVPITLVEQGFNIRTSVESACELKPFSIICRSAHASFKHFISWGLQSQGRAPCQTVPLAEEAPRCPSCSSFLTLVGHLDPGSWTFAPKAPHGVPLGKHSRGAQTAAAKLGIENMMPYFVEMQKEFAANAGEH